MNNRKELKFLLTVSEKVVSVNSLYQAGLKYIAGKPRPYVYKNPKAIKLENEILDQLRALDLSDYIDWLKNTKQFTITISFIVKTNVTRRDVQNMDKQLIDVITKYIKEDLGVDKFDDSLFTSVHFYKSIIPKAQKEYCCVQIVESKEQIRLDQTEKPEKVLILGGEDIPAITKLFSEGELTQGTLEDHDTEFYLITPETFKPDIAAKMINSVWECLSRGSGFVWIGILESDMWEESLQATLDLINNIAQGSSRIRAKYIKDPKEILSNESKEK